MLMPPHDAGMYLFISIATLRHLVELIVSSILCATCVIGLLFFFGSLIQAIGRQKWQTDTANRSTGKLK